MNSSSTSLASPRTSGPGGMPTHPRLGRNAFAHLRGVYQGLDLVDCAKRYLDVDHGAQARSAHRLVVEQVQAVARRRGDTRWRLLSLTIPQASGRSDKGALPDTRPTLEAWAEAQGLDGWSEDELLAMYEEHFAASVDAPPARRLQRNERLQRRRLALLYELEQLALEPAKASDTLDGWLSPQTADALRRSGLLTLGELRMRIHQGGRWWRSIPAFGPTKGQRLAAHVELLLGGTPAWPVETVEVDLTRLDGRHGLNRDRSLQVVQIDAQDDRQAIRAWIEAKATSPHTQAQYRRELERFILFCVLERGKALSDANVSDCRAYLDFLARIPDSWISRRKVAHMAPGWAPFRGQLSRPSQQLALTVVQAAFNWLVAARWLNSNPWVLINCRLGDEAPTTAAAGGGGADPTSRAFTPRAWRALLTELGRDNSPSTQRLRWICTFMASTGLRSAEVVRATRADAHQTPEGWMLRVLGKGRRVRSVPIPSFAVEATREYFASRGLDWEECGPATPLLASLDANGQAVTYRALYKTFKLFVARAMKHSDLSIAERLLAAQASNHWLRHTFGTRAAESGIDLDVLQAILGHKGPRTTAHYYRAQQSRQQQQVERLKLDPAAA